MVEVDVSVVSDDNGTEGEEGSESELEGPGKYFCFFLLLTQQLQKKLTFPQRCPG